jgi:hypothetical protein
MTPIDANVRREYGQLLSDMKQQIAQRQLIFGDRTRSAIETFARKVQPATQLAFCSEEEELDRISSRTILCSDGHS